MDVVGGRVQRHLHVRQSLRSERGAVGDVGSLLGEILSLQVERARHHSRVAQPPIQIVKAQFQHQVACAVCLRPAQFVKLVHEVAVGITTRLGTHHPVDRLELRTVRQRVADLMQCPRAFLLTRGRRRTNQPVRVVHAAILATHGQRGDEVLGNLQRHIRRAPSVETVEFAPVLGERLSHAPRVEAVDVGVADSAAPSDVEQFDATTIICRPGEPISATKILAAHCRPQLHTQTAQRAGQPRHPVQGGEPLRFDHCLADDLHVAHHIVTRVDVEDSLLQPHRAAHLLETHRPDVEAVEELDVAPACADQSPAHHPHVEFVEVVAEEIAEVVLEVVRVRHAVLALRLQPMQEPRHVACAMVLLTASAQRSDLRADLVRAGQTGFQ